MKNRDPYVQKLSTVLFSPFCFLRHVVVRERRSVLGFCLVTLSLAETVECCQSEGDLALVAQRWIRLSTG